MAYEILKIYLEEQLLIRHYMIKLLLLLNIQNVMDINMNLLQWFNFFFFFHETFATYKETGSNYENKQLAD